MVLSPASFEKDSPQQPLLPSHGPTTFLQLFTHLLFTSTPSVFHQLMVIVIPSCILPTPGIDLEKCSSTLFLNSRTLIWSSLHFKTQGVPELTYLGVTSENYWSPEACYSDAFIIFWLWNSI